MNIHALPGSKVRFTGKGGWDSGQYACKHLQAEESIPSTECRYSIRGAKLN